MWKQFNCDPLSRQVAILRRLALATQGSQLECSPQRPSHLGLARYVKSEKKTSTVRLRTQALLLCHLQHLASEATSQRERTHRACSEWAQPHWLAASGPTGLNLGSTRIRSLVPTQRVLSASNEEVETACFSTWPPPIPWRGGAKWNAVSTYQWPASKEQS